MATTCPSCSRQIGEDFAFCPYCGASTAPPAPLHEQRKRVSILFCDVSGSTALGESIDPEALRALLARYFHRMKEIIESHGGTVEKFIGDAVMAVFGVPVLHEDDAWRACRAAIEMQAALPELGIRCRIGINSGEVVTGTEERLATGDAVNVAARLEQAAEAGEILIGEETRRLVRDAVQVEAISPLELKGKSGHVPAFRLLRLNETVDRPHAPAPMIGRERELRRLQDSFAQAVEDRSCQLFTILGSAGVGKSRLAREFLAGSSQGRVVVGRCLSYGDGITYFPVVDILQQLDALPTDSYAAAIIQSLLGERGIATSPEEIAWAVRKVLEEHAERAPLIVVFDDIHWGEETFLDLVEHIADLSRDAAILLLCMARPELLEKRPAWGGGKWNATTVLLEPLDAEETTRLVESLGNVSDVMRDRIRLAAEGNPLFVEEMVALIRESGGEEISIPPTIQALLAARLDQLAPDERSVLECGAVEGRIFHRNALQALATGSDDVRGKLIGLVRKELVRPERTQFPGDEAYRFRHLLIRDAAYEALPKALRAELHEKFAGWLEEHGTDLPELDEIVGYHLEQAAYYRHELGQPDANLARQAGEQLARAALSQRWRRGDYRTAAGLLRRALTLLRPLRPTTYLEMELLQSQGLPMEQRAAGLAAIAARAREAGDVHGEMVAGAAAARARILAGSGESTAALEATLRDAIPVLEAVNDHEGLFQLWNVLRDVANNKGLYEEYAQACEQMIRYGQQLGRRGLFYLPVALMWGPRPAEDCLRTLKPLLADDPHPGPLAAVAYLQALLGNFEGTRAVVQTSSDRLEELSGEIGPMGIVAKVMHLEGDHEAAREQLQRYCDALEQRGELAVLSTYYPELGRELCLLGRYDEAETLAQRGRELGAEDDVLTQVLWRQVMALVLGHRGEFDAAERLAREAVAIAEQTDAVVWQGDALWDLAEVLVQAGRSAEAIATFEDAMDRYARKQNLVMVARVRERLAALAGENTSRAI
ncbi:MAG TPA: adenylate/guanylate cyclase domain-containing protein [Chloroflexota bacterium]|nr:adenylate/guanylate cyclase domain-containing protein [Chloroflexota bacterium]